MLLIGVSTLVMVISVLDSALCGHHRNLRKEQTSEKIDSSFPKLPRKLPFVPLADVAEDVQRPRRSVNPKDLKYYTGTTSPPAWLGEALTIALKIDNLFEAFTGQYSTGEGSPAEITTETPTDVTFGKCDKCCNYCECCNYCVFMDEPQFDHLMYLAHEEGYLSYKQARNCYNYCKGTMCTSGEDETLSVTPSRASEQVPTFPPEKQLEIEVVTGAVELETMRRGRQHCYQTIRPQNVTANDKELCHWRYKPTSDGPKPSRRPLGLNVWTCCRDISNDRRYRFGV